MSLFPGDSIKKNISKEELNELPLWQYDGKVILVQDPKMASDAVQILLQCPLLGFDTESRPAFKRGQHFDPSLVQLASNECVYLFQLPLIGGLNPLLPLFENGNTLKVCLGVGEDIRRLKKAEPFHDQGFVELLKPVKALGIGDAGLRKLCGNLLGIRISKREQTSNWARLELSPSQQRYAATDAWVSRLIYLRACELIALQTSPLGKSIFLGNSSRAL